MEISKYRQQYLEQYSKGGEEFRLFGSKADNSEYIITNKYIDRFLHEGARIIDIGAGAGAYSKALAERGFKVDALDLHPLHVEKLNEALSEYKNAHAYLTDATDLSGF